MLPPPCRFTGLYIRCSNETKPTGPCGAAHKGVEWDQAPVYALRSDMDGADHANQTVFHVLIRDTGVWRLAEVSNGSEPKLEWPGSAV